MRSKFELMRTNRARRARSLDDSLGEFAQALRSTLNAQSGGSPFRASEGNQFNSVMSARDLARNVQFFGSTPLKGGEFCAAGPGNASEQFNCARDVEVRSNPTKRRGVEEHAHAPAVVVNDCPATGPAKHRLALIASSIRERISVRLAQLAQQLAQLFRRKGA